MKPTDRATRPTAPTARQLLAPWLGRRSTGPRRLVAPGPDEEELDVLLAAARNVSDHGRLRPCRIVAVGLPQRQRLAGAFVEYAASVRGLASPDELDPDIHHDECAKAFNAPALLCVLARIGIRHPPDDDIAPVHEQWMSVGASLGVLMGAASALGYAGKALSGARVDYPAVRAVVCRPDEVLACFVYLGSVPSNC